jgi:hypothetical protein
MIRGYPNEAPEMTRSNDAVDQLPIRLLMSLAIVSAILLLLVGASDAVRTVLAEQQIETQCRSVEASLLTMVSNGGMRDVDDPFAGDGAKRMLTFTLPDSIVFLSFGGNPDPTNTGVLSSELLQEGSVICYKVQGGSTHVLWLPFETVRFREGILINGHWMLHGGGQSFIIHSGGIVTMVFEYVEQNHDSFILIHNTDDID